MFNTICRIGAVGAGAASRYGFGSGFGSDQMMWFLAAPAPQISNKIRMSRIRIALTSKPLYFLIVTNAICDIFL
jgi:hypothetical protein